MLQISHLYADYGGKPALEDINLTLESGELLVVLGPSGCGKTTLLNLIAGSPAKIAALASATLALGATYWLLRKRGDRAAETSEHDPSSSQ